MTRSHFGASISRSASKVHIPFRCWRSSPWWLIATVGQSLLPCTAATTHYSRRSSFLEPCSTWFQSCVAIVKEKENSAACSTQFRRSRRCWCQQPRCSGSTRIPSCSIQTRLLLSSHQRIITHAMGRSVDSTLQMVIKFGVSSPLLGNYTGSAQSRQSNSCTSTSSTL